MSSVSWWLSYHVFPWHAAGKCRKNMIQREADRWSESAAVYVRMSTERLRESTGIQRSVIREYARQRGLVIVKEYGDEGKGGPQNPGQEAEP